MSTLKITNARTHNLKNVSLELPHNKLIVFSGISGSGKSSLVYDVIFREGERLFLQSFSNASKILFRNLSKPDVDSIDGLRPMIAVGQQNANYSARSTVGTITDVYGFLRLLFARFGKAKEGIALSRSLFSFNSPVGACPKCSGLGMEEFIDINKLIKDPSLTLDQGAMVITTDNGYIMYSQVTMEVLNRVCTAHGFSVSIPWNELTEEQQRIVLYGSDIIKIPYGKHTLESRLKWTGITAKPREEGVYKGIVPVMEDILKRDRNDNILRFVSSRQCSGCHGTRLNNSALSVLWQDCTIAQYCDMQITDLHNEMLSFAPNSSDENERKVLEEILRRLKLLVDLDLGTLTLAKSGTDLQSSEKKAIRLINQLFGGMSNLIYVFDEPAAGLHPSTAQTVFRSLQQLRDAGNTVLVIEHNPYFQLHADVLMDIGPLAGANGGKILFVDSPKNISNYIGTSLTAKALLSRNNAPVSKSTQGDSFVVDIVTQKTEIKNITFSKSAINVVTGIKNSGNDRPMFDLLVEHFEQNNYGFSKCITIDGSRPGKTSRSTPATYTGIFDTIRKLYAQASEKRFTASDFSFNNKNYSCPECEGAGFVKLGMHFLGSSQVECSTCRGKRYVDEILIVQYSEKNISQVLEMSVDDAVPFFSNQPKVHKLLSALKQLGCGYLSLGQSSSTLSGGEAQRVKLSSYLAEKVSGDKLFIFDQPVSGMHTHDAQLFLAACLELAEKGETVILLENSKSAMESAHRVVELLQYPNGTGEVVFNGTSNDFAKSETPTAMAFNASSENETDSIQPQFEQAIQIVGATTHNLKNETLAIPKNKITVITGPSGSGKTSMAFDTLYAAARNRYLNNFSSYIREKIGLLPQTNVEAIHGLIPAIGISGKITVSDRRSTVGTASGIYDLYRLFYARFGENRPENTLSDLFSFNRPAGACSTCTGNGVVMQPDAEKLISHPHKSLMDGALSGTKTGIFYGDPFGQYVATLLAAGKHVGIDFSLPFCDLNADAQAMAMHGLPDIELDVVWRYKRKNREGVHEMKAVWKGFLNYVEEEFLRESMNGKTPWVEEVMSELKCPACRGARLKPEVLAITVNDKNISMLTNDSISENITLFSKIANSQNELITSEILRKLENLRALGLSYLSLSRTRNTLSAGESRRLSLAEMVNSGITGTLFVVDEPSLGLGDSDIETFNALMQNVKGSGNTVVLVDHHPNVIRNADYIVEFGPTGGKKGGYIVAKGSPNEIENGDGNLTGNLLRGLKLNVKKRQPFTQFLEIKGAHANNLKGFDVQIPTNALTVFRGESGSGKSSLALDCIAPSVEFGKAVGCQSISGYLFNKRVVVTNGVIPKNSSDKLFSEYCGLFDPIKKLFATEIKTLKIEIKPSALSFRSSQGYCEECKGKGVTEINLDFIAESETLCGACSGKRYRNEVLDIYYHGKNIADILELTVDESITFFCDLKSMVGKLQILNSIGLGYLCLGQELSTLSGGEIRRAKLAKMVFETKSEPTLIVMDEPSSGLFYTDIEKLTVLFDKLLQQGHTLLVTEHNQQIIAHADYTIHLGPEGGEKGGFLLDNG